MPNRGRTGRLGKGKDCDETAQSDHIGGRGCPRRQGRPRDGRDHGCGSWSW